MHSVSHISQSAPGWYYTVRASFSQGSASRYSVIFTKTFQFLFLWVYDRSLWQFAGLFGRTLTALKKKIAIHLANSTCKLAPGALRASTSGSLRRQHSYAHIPMEFPAIKFTLLWQLKKKFSSNSTQKKHKKSSYDDIGYGDGRRSKRSSECQKALARSSVSPRTGESAWHRKSRRHERSSGNDRGNHTRLAYNVHATRCARTNLRILDVVFFSYYVFFFFVFLSVSRRWSLSVRRAHV